MDHVSDKLQGPARHICYIAHGQQFGNLQGPTQHLFVNKGGNAAWNASQRVSLQAQRTAVDRILIWLHLYHLQDTHLPLKTITMTLAVPSKLSEKTLQAVGDLPTCYQIAPDRRHRRLNQPDRLRLLQAPLLHKHGCPAASSPSLYIAALHA